MAKEITLEAYAMGRDLLFPEEWVLAKENALLLIPRVNILLKELFPGVDLHVRSGFRPSAINEKTPGAAKQSLHMIGKAIDISDGNGFFLKNLVPAQNMHQAARMRALGLFMEEREASPTWLHLDIGDRPDRPSRTFKIK